MKKTKITLQKFFYSVAITLVGVLALFYLNSKNTAQKQGEIKVATTVFALYNITKQIAGDKITVVQLLPSGENPSTYEPTSENKESVLGANVVFVAGAGVDDWALQLAEEEQVETLDLSKSVMLSSKEEDVNSYYWLSPTNGKLAAFEIYKELSYLDPTNENYYQGNYISLTSQIDEARDYSIEQFSSLTIKDIATVNNYFNYFFADLGLSVIATINPSQSEELTPTYLTQIETTIKEQEIHVIFSASQGQDSITTTLVQDIGAIIYALDPEGGTEGRDSYVSLIRYNTAIVVSALSSK